MGLTEFPRLNGTLENDHPPYILTWHAKEPSTQTNGQKRGSSRSIFAKSHLQITIHQLPMSYVCVPRGYFRASIHRPSISNFNLGLPDQ